MELKLNEGVPIIFTPIRFVEFRFPVDWSIGDAIVWIKSMGINSHDLIKIDVIYSGCACNGHRFLYHNRDYMMDATTHMENVKIELV